MRPQVFCPTGDLFCISKQQLDDEKTTIEVVADGDPSARVEWFRAMHNDEGVDSFENWAADKVSPICAAW